MQSKLHVFKDKVKQQENDLNLLLDRMDKMERSVNSIF